MFLSVYCFPQFFPKHGFTLLWFQNFTGLQGNYSFGLCHWCKSHCSSQTPVGPAAMGVLGSEVRLLWRLTPKRFGQRFAETIELHTFGWMLCSWWFHFPTCVLFFKFSPTWEDDHLTFVFKLGACWKQWFGVMLPLCLLWFFFCASTNPSSFQFTGNSIVKMYIECMNCMWIPCMSGGVQQVEGFNPKTSMKGGLHQKNQALRQPRLRMSKVWRFRYTTKVNTSHQQLNILRKDFQYFLWEGWCLEDMFLLG